MGRDFVKTFEAHGCDFTGTSGDQLIGTCPFTGKANKFYLNKNNGLWDSKVAGLSGNLSTFLEQRARDYRKALRSSKLKRLAEDRELDERAFLKWSIGWDEANEVFTLPVMDIGGKVTDIRRYNMRRKLMMSTAGCAVGLIGAQKLPENKQDPVYLCEGEWDAIAMRWLLEEAKERGVVVGVPGAGTFKPEWAQWLAGRTVHTLYDYDAAGRAGELKAQSRLTGVARSVTYVHWPDEVPNGFDTRDWVVYGVTKNRTPEICLDRLKRRFSNQPKVAEGTERQTTGSIRIRRRKSDRTKMTWAKKNPTIDDVHSVFKKWLFLRSTDVIDIMLATLMTQKIDGSPVWVFVVGPPGSAKTAIVSSLQDVNMTYAISTLTAPSLISGATMNGGADPSLIPKIDQKVLVVKDFTSILSLPDREQKEIFGILRDAYDGRCSKTFGNGVERHYESRFTVMAAVTPRIYDLADQHAALGERFLKFLVGDNLHHISENEVIERAIENSDKDALMRAELAEVVKAYIEQTCATVVPATMSRAYLQKTVALAKFGARLRGNVSRDWYHRDIVMSRPTAEVGTRLGQQLSKLARGLAMVYGRTEVNDTDYNTIKKVMLDTISQRNEDVLRAMIQAMGGPHQMTPMSLREMSHKTSYPFATIQRLMQDLHALQIVKRVGIGMHTTWTLSEYVHQEIVAAGLYTDDELTRPTIGRIKLKLRLEREGEKLMRIRTGKLVVPPNNS